MKDHSPRCSRHPKPERMRSSLILSASAVFLVGGAQYTSSNLQKYTIAAHGINASFIGYGARLTNLLVNDKHGMPQDIVLGYDDALLYINDTEHEHTYFGAVGELSVVSASWHLLLDSESRTRWDQRNETTMGRVTDNHTSGKIRQPHEKRHLHNRPCHFAHYPERPHGP